MLKGSLTFYSALFILFKSSYIKMFIICVIKKINQKNFLRFVEKYLIADNLNVWDIF